MFPPPISASIETTIVCKRKPDRRERVVFSCKSVHSVRRRAWVVSLYLSVRCRPTYGQTYSPGPHDHRRRLRRLLRRPSSLLRLDESRRLSTCAEGSTERCGASGALACVGMGGAWPRKARSRKARLNTPSPARRTRAMASGPTDSAISRGLP